MEQAARCPVLYVEVARQEEQPDVQWGLSTFCTGQARRTWSLVDWGAWQTRPLSLSLPHPASRLVRAQQESSCSSVLVPAFVSASDALPSEISGRLTPSVSSISVLITLDWPGLCPGPKKELPRPALAQHEREAGARVFPASVSLPSPTPQQRGGVPPLPSWQEGPPCLLSSSSPSPAQGGLCW